MSREMMDLEKVRERLRANRPSPTECSMNCVWCDAIQLAEEVERLRRGYDFVGVEAEPCPGCVYEKGKFIRRCKLHERIDGAEEENAKLQEALMHGPKIGSIIQRGDPSRYLQIVNTYTRDGHLVVVVDGAAIPKDETPG